MTDITVEVGTRQPIEVSVGVRQPIEVDIVRAGATGPVGPRGDGDKTFTYSFSIQSELTINHGLAKYPSVTIIDSANDEVEGDVDYVDMNHVHIKFSAPFSGVVVFN